MTSPVTTFPSNCAVGVILPRSSTSSVSRTISESPARMVGGNSSVSLRDSLMAGRGVNAGRLVGSTDGKGAIGSLPSTSGGAEPVPRSMANQVTADKIHRQKTAVMSEKTTVRLLDRMTFRKQKCLKAGTSQALAIAALLARWVEHASHDAQVQIPKPKAKWKWSK